MLLSVQKVAKKFPVSRGFWGRPLAFVTALDGVSVEIGAGQIVGVVGESGCGKSTLGRCVVGLLAPSEGGVYWDGREVEKMNPGQRRLNQSRFQMVFQNPFASLNPRQKIREVLVEPLEVHDWLKPSERTAFAAGLLEKVGLSAGDLEKFPHEFSGGQRQRIGIARSLAGRPELIVLDEPVSSLDVSVQASILNLLSRINGDQGISYLFISHDLQVIGYLSQRMIVMYLGKVVEEGATEPILNHPRHPYTKVLLEASRGQKTSLQGDPPSPVTPPSGCAFHPRCPFAEGRCLAEKQELAETGKGWKVACWKWDRL